MNYLKKAGASTSLMIALGIGLLGTNSSIYHGYLKSKGW